MRGWIVRADYAGSKPQLYLGDRPSHDEYRPGVLVVKKGTVMAGPLSPEAMAALGVDLDEIDRGGIVEIDLSVVGSSEEPDVPPTEE